MKQKFTCLALSQDGVQDNSSNKDQSFPCLKQSIGRGGIYFGAAIAGVLITTALVVGTTFATDDGADQIKKWFSPAKHAAIMKAIDNGDYGAFQAEVAVQGKLGDYINQENFDKFREMHSLMQAGDVAGAQAIADELGLPDMRGHRMFKHKGLNSENFAAIKNAIDNGDYAAWAEIMDEKGDITNVITAENFDKFVEMHKLIQSGDKEGAQAIADELGLPAPMDMGAYMFRGKKMHEPLHDINGDGVCDYAE